MSMPTREQRVELDRRYFIVEKLIYEVPGTIWFTATAWNKDERRGAVVHSHEEMEAYYGVTRINHEGFVGGPVPVPFAHKSDAEDYASAYVRGLAD